MSLDTRWEDVDTLLDRTTRTRDETLAKAVQEIVALRFKFPTPEHPAYRAHVNVPDVTHAGAARRGEDRAGHRRGREAEHRRHAARDDGSGR